MMFIVFLILQMFWRIQTISSNNIMNLYGNNVKSTWCQYGIMNYNFGSSCYCVHSGLWSFHTTMCKEAINLIGVDEKSKSPYCFPDQFHNKLKYAQKLSFDGSSGQAIQLSEGFSIMLNRFNKTTPRAGIVYARMSDIVVIGETEWTVETKKGKRRCLTGHRISKKFYCVFANVPLTHIIRMKVGCPKEVKKKDPIVADECNEYFKDENAGSFCPKTKETINLSEDGTVIRVPGRDTTYRNMTEKTKIIEKKGEIMVDSDTSFLKSRKRREITRQRRKDEDTLNRESMESFRYSEKGHFLYDEMEDEDFIPKKHKEIGHHLIQYQVIQYVESAIGRLTGIKDEGLKPKARKYPVLQLLDLSKKIMEKTCIPVNQDYFNLAMNVVINLLLETFRVNEPYVPYGAYLRIQGALMRCLANAEPHEFVTEESQSRSEYQCRDETKKTSNMAIKDGETHNLNIPNYALGYEEDRKTIKEPLVETVWKIVVNAHSYCFKEFSDYYNDHHTYTVAMMPLFSNEIQDLWQQDYNLEAGTLYGGMLGDVMELLQDINHCVAASRLGSAYPWFMNKPPKTQNPNKYRMQRSASTKWPYIWCAKKGLEVMKTCF